MKWNTIFSLYTIMDHGVRPLETKLFLNIKKVHNILKAEFDSCKQSSYLVDVVCCL